MVTKNPTASLNRELNKLEAYLNRPSSLKSKVNPSLSNAKKSMKGFSQAVDKFAKSNNTKKALEWGSAKPNWEYYMSKSPAKVPMGDPNWRFYENKGVSVRPQAIEAELADALVKSKGGAGAGPKTFETTGSRINPEVSDALTKYNGMKSGPKTFETTGRVIRPASGAGGLGLLGRLAGPMMTAGTALGSTLYSPNLNQPGVDPEIDRIENYGNLKNDGYESPLMKGIIDDVMSGKSTEVPDRKFMTDTAPYESPLFKGILDDTMNQINGGPAPEVPDRKFMTDVEPKPANAPIAPKVSSKSKKKVFSQFPPTQKLQAPTGFDAPAQAPQQDSLMAQLERALRAKEEAIGQNMNQYRGLASAAADYKPTASFGGLIDYANFQSGGNMRPAEDNSYDERSQLMGRLQQQLATGNEAMTAPNIDLAEAKIKMDQYNQEMALKKEQNAQSAKEKEADRIFKMGLLKEQIAGRIQAAALIKGNKLTLGMKALSIETAKELAPFTSGGRETLEDTIEKLKGAVLTMERDPSITGSTKASLTAMLPGTGYTNPKLKALIDNVIEPVFQTMRSKIGAQFTAQESLQLQRLALDPNLPVEANKKKVLSALNILEKKRDQLQNKLDYFQMNEGDMTGFKADLGVTKQAQPKDLNSLSDAELQRLAGE